MLLRTTIHYAVRALLACNRLIQVNTRSAVVVTVHQSRLLRFKKDFNYGVALIDAVTEASGSRTWTRTVTEVVGALGTSTS